MKESERIKRYLVHRLGERGRSKKGLVRLIQEYPLWVDPNADGLEYIRKYIEAHKLDKVTKEHEIAYQRFYLFAYLRKHTTLSYQTMADMTGLDSHASVMHGIKKHYLWVEQRDPEYMNIISEVRKYFII